MAKAPACKEAKKQFLIIHSHEKAHTVTCIHIHTAVYDSSRSTGERLRNPHREMRTDAVFNLQDV